MSNKYPFTKIKQEIARRNGRALDFAVGERLLPISGDLSAWLKRHYDLALSPATPDDVATFSSAAVTFLADQYGVEVGSAQILPTAGGRAAMGLLAACTLSSDQSVVVTEPGYPAFARLAEQHGVNVIRTELDPANGFAPDFDFSDVAAESQIAAFAFNYPNNPTGAALSENVRRKLFSLARDGVIFFNDATYGPMVYDEPPRSLLGESFADGQQPEVIELHSFSKHYPLGPLAVSFLAGSAKQIDQLATYSEYAWSPLSKLQLAVTARCLDDTERLQQFRDLIPTRLEALFDVLAAIGLRPYRAAAGNYVICDAPSEVGGRRVASAFEAAQELMERYDVASVPLGSSSRSYLRFSALYRAQDLARLGEIGPTLHIR